MSKIKRVLFVCTGNSCRSIMAEGLLRKKLEELGRSDIEVSSAGTCAVGGFVPTAMTVSAMKEEGVDVSGYKTTRLTPDKIYNADLILAMETRHVDAILNLDPNADGKTYLLRRYARVKNEPGGVEVMDPIGRPLEIYERVLTMIKKSIEELVKLL
ncbi:MAG: low molecular weight protein arginine phosphatase [Candidatus Omnitrophota bacterium]